MRWSSKRTQALLFVALLVANFAALNLIVAGASPHGPLGAAVQALRTRIDLTEGEEYTISDATRKILARLPDTVTIHAYFSAETHPKLQPLVPRIRDLLEEYQVAADGKVQLEFADPSADEERAREVYQRFGIRPTPFRVQSLYESGVKSAYFHLVVSYGDQYETLGFDDLVRVEPTPSG
ncbi:MAG: ABC transporter permease, partial [Planctomycetota bacterium]